MEVSSWLKLFTGSNLVEVYYMDVKIRKLVEVIYVDVNLRKLVMLSNKMLRCKSYKVGSYYYDVSNI